MTKWKGRYGKSHTKAGQYRSSRAIKQDRRQQSNQSWEQKVSGFGWFGLKRALNRIKP